MTAAASLLTIASRLGGSALDLILPPRCLACGIEVDAPQGLCPPCWNDLRLFSPPGAAPAAFPCRARFGLRPHGLRPSVAAVRSPGARRYATMATVRGSSCVFKRGGQLTGCTFASPLGWREAGEELLRDGGIPDPTGAAAPLATRLCRGFNQSAVLAQRIAADTRSAPGPRRCFPVIASPHRRK